MLRNRTVRQNRRALRQAAMKAAANVVETLESRQLLIAVIDFEYNREESPHEFTFQYSEDVGEPFTAANFQLHNLLNSAAEQSSKFTSTYDSQSATGVIRTANYLAGETSGFAGILPDGNYDVILNLPPDDEFLPDPALNELFFFNGDFNRDRVVNMADFSILTSHWNQAGQFSQGDATFDGTVNNSDFSLLGSRFNAALSAPPPGANSLQVDPWVDGTMLLQWSAPENSEGILGYRIWRSLDGIDFGAGPVAEVTDPKETSWVDDTGLTEGTKYYYRVRAYSDTGNAPTTNKESGIRPLLTPSGVGAVVSGDESATVSWIDNSTHETGFVIWRQFTGPGGVPVSEAWAEVDAREGTGAVSATVAGLDPGTQYRFWIQAVSDGTQSSPSVQTNPVTTTSRRISAVPTSGTDIVGTFFEVELSWSNIDAQLSWTIDWGDGSEPEVVPGPLNTSSGSMLVDHDYPEPPPDAPEEGYGTYLVSIDAVAASKPYSAESIEVNVRPSALEVLPPDNSANRRKVLSIFEDIYNNYEFEPYVGIKKGVDATESTKTGNAWDLAALLREKIEPYSNTRFVVGIVHAAPDKVRQWLGVADDEAAENILQTIGAGVLNDPIYGLLPFGEELRSSPGGDFNFWHVGVEVQFSGESTWAYLDPSWKYKDIRIDRIDDPRLQNLDIGEGDTAFSSSTEANYWSGHDGQSPLDWYKTKLLQEIRSHGHSEGRTALSDLRYDGPIIRKRFVRGMNPAIPNIDQFGEYTFQSNRFTRVTSFDAKVFPHNGNQNIGIDFRHRVVFDIYDGVHSFDTNANGEISATWDMATAWEFAFAVQYNGDTAQFYQDDGIAAGNTTTISSANVTTRLKFLSPHHTNVTHIDRVVGTVAPKGQPVGIALGSRQLSQADVMLRQEIVNNEVSKETSFDPKRYQRWLLALAGMRYFHEWQAQKDEIAKLTWTKVVQEEPEAGFVLGSADAMLWDPARWRLNNPVQFKYMGFDLPGLETGFWPIRDHLDAQANAQTRRRTAEYLAGYTSSWLEHAIVEDVGNRSGVSTVKEILQQHLADSTKVRRLTHNQANLQTAINNLFPGQSDPWVAGARQQIRDALAQSGPGARKAEEVVVVDNIITENGATPWTGVAWIERRFDATPLDRADGDGFQAFTLYGSDGMKRKGSLSVQTPQVVQTSAAAVPAKRGPMRGDPVNQYTGAFYHDEVDLSIPSPGLPLSFGRHYQSDRVSLAASHADRGMGFGWLHTYAEYLEVPTPSATARAYINRADGQRHEFAYPSAGQFTPLEGEFGKLVFLDSANNENDKYVYVDVDGVQRTFGVKGRLEEIRDRNNNRIKLRYKSNTSSTADYWRLNQASHINGTVTTDASDRWISFTRNADARIEFVRDHTGREWDFRYKKTGSGTSSRFYLETAKLPSLRTADQKTVVYVYHTNDQDVREGRLTSIEHWINRRKVNTVFEGTIRGIHRFSYYANGRAFKSTDALGASEYFTFNLFNSDLATGQTNIFTRSSTHVDLNGESTVFEFGKADGLVRRTKHPDGNFVEQTWNADYGALTQSKPLIRSITNEVGLTTAFQYNSNGFVSRRIERSWEDVPSPTSALGFVTEYTYVTRNLTQPSLTNVSFTAGIDTETIEPGTGQRITDYAYDSKGNVTSVQDAEGNTTTFGYSNPTNGLPVWKKLPVLTSTHSPANEDDFKIDYVYDSKGSGQVSEEKQLRRIGSTGIYATVSRDFDTLGNIKWEKDGTQYSWSGQSIARQVNFDYDPLNQVIKKRVSDGPSGTTGDIITSYAYEDGLLRSMTDPRNIQTVYTYDKIGRVIAVTTSNYRKEMGYDALGNVIASRVLDDKLNRESKSFYDSRNRLVQTIEVDGAFRRVWRDGAGRELAVLEPFADAAFWNGDKAVITENEYYTEGGAVKFALGPAAFDAFGGLIGLHYGKVIGREYVEFLRNQFDEVTTEYHKQQQSPDLSDSTHNEIRYQHDNLGRAYERRGSDGIVTFTDFDEHGNVFASARYDVDGVADIFNVALSGLPRQESITYFDNHDRPRRQLDPEQNQTEADFDDAGRVVLRIGARAWESPRTGSATDKEAFSTAYEYDGVGNEVKMTLPDPDGQTPFVKPTLKRTFDGNGNVKSEKAPGHADTVLTEFSYDNLNRLRARTAPSATIVVETTPFSTSSLRTTESLGYNRAGDLTLKTNDRGRTTSYGYDARGRRTSETLPSPSTGATGGGPVTSSLYNAAGNLVRTTDPSGMVTENEYDHRDRVISVVRDARAGSIQEVTSPQTRWRISLSNHGYLAREKVEINIPDVHTGVHTIERWVDANTFEIASQGTLAPTSVTVRRPTLRYSYPGRPVIAVGPADTYGLEETATIDELGRRWSTYSDALGRPVLGYLSYLDQTDRLWKKEYSSLGSIVAEEQYINASTARRTDFHYDNLNRVVRVEAPTTADGRAVTKTYYDDAGNVTSVIHPLGAALNESSAISNGLHTTTYTYDTWNRRLTETLADADSNSATPNDRPKSQFAYDGNNNVTDVWHFGVANNDHEKFFYDARDRLTSEEKHVFLNSGQADVTATRSYDYDANGNTRRITDRRGKQRRFQYDAIDRQQFETWHTSSGAQVANSTIAFTYDANGRRLSADSNWQNASDTNLDYELAYNAIGQLQKVTDDRADATLVYQYDAVGNRQALFGKRGIGGGATDDFINDYIYNQHSQLWQLRQSVAPVGGSPDRAVKNIIRNGLNFSDEPTEQIPQKGTAPASDPFAANIGHVHYSTTEGMTFDGAGQMLSRGDFVVDRDISGRVTSVQRIEGIPDTRGFVYDANHQITGSPGTSESFGYDNNFNRTNRTATTSDTYDIGLDNRIKTAGTWVFSYDEEGNLLEKRKNSPAVNPERWNYTYDHRNRLTNVAHTTSGNTTPATVATYEYDADDRRVRKFVDSTTDVDERYVFDGANAVMVIGASGNLISRYMYGLAPDDVIAHDHIGGGGVAQTRWFKKDLQGTIQTIRDNDGNLIDHLDYSPFGERRDVVTPATEPRHGYTGQMYDLETGFNYYGARFYDAGLGRFLNQDPAEEGTNLYAYVGNNSLNMTDPTGLSAAAPAGGAGAGGGAGGMMFGGPAVVLAPMIASAVMHSTTLLAGDKFDYAKDIAAMPAPAAARAGFTPNREFAIAIDDNYGSTAAGSKLKEWRPGAALWQDDPSRIVLSARRVTGASGTPWIEFWSQAPAAQTLSQMAFQQAQDRQMEALISIYTMAAVGDSAAGVADGLSRLNPIVSLSAAGYELWTGENFNISGKEASRFDAGLELFTAGVLPAALVRRTDDLADAVSAIQHMDPKNIRFSQYSVTETMGNGQKLEDAIALLGKGFTFDDLGYGPVRVVTTQGRTWALDHRRLVAAQQAGLENIPVIHLDLNDLAVQNEFVKKWNPIGGANGGTMTIISPSREYAKKEVFPLLVEHNKVNPKGPK